MPQDPAFDSPDFERIYIYASAQPHTGRVHLFASHGRAGSAFVTDGIFDTDAFDEADAAPAIAIWARLLAITEAITHKG